MISLAHLKFRAAKNRAGITPFFKAFGSPFVNYLCLAFMGLILVLLWLGGQTIALALIPVWLLINFLGYLYRCHVGFPAPVAAEPVE